MRQLTFVFLLFLPYLITAQTISAEVFKPLEGLYTGTLTYTDYQSGQLTAMPLVANAVVDDNGLKVFIEINENGRRYDQSYSYKIKNGQLSGWDLRSNELTNGGNLVLIRKGKDARRAAQFRTTIAPTSEGFRITKEVRFIDDGDSAAYFIRNQYDYQRVKAITAQPSTYRAISQSGGQ